MSNKSYFKLRDYSDTHYLIVRIRNGVENPLILMRKDFQNKEEAKQYVAELNTRYKYATTNREIAIIEGCRLQGKSEKETQDILNKLSKGNG